MNFVVVNNNKSLKGLVVILLSVIPTLCHLFKNSNFLAHNLF